MVFRVARVADVYICIRSSQADRLTLTMHACTCLGRHSTFCMLDGSPACVFAARSKKIVSSFVSLSTCMCCSPIHATCAAEYVCALLASCMHHACVLACLHYRTLRMQLRSDTAPPTTSKNSGVRLKKEYINKNGHIIV